jgi:putative ABC transport system permease protein
VRIKLLQTIIQTSKFRTMNLGQIFRSLLRDRLNTAVILISLAVGMACINLILLFIYREVETDSFHKNANRIYLLNCDNPFEKGTKMSQCRLGGVEYMAQNFSQVEDFCRVGIISIHKIVVNGQTYYDKPAVYEASSNFFNFFSFNLLTNNPNTVLETESDIAISEELAGKYFGDISPIGKLITMTNGKTTHDYSIKGIFRKPASNSMFSFDMVKLKKETERYAFVRLRDKTDPSDLEKIFAKEKEKIPNVNDGTPGQYYLQSLKQVYFDNQYSPLGNRRDKKDLWIALIIGLLIIGVASFNYLGLVNMRLLNKTFEFRIRKINGASLRSIIFNFMKENFYLLLIALAICLELMSWIIPIFNSLTGTDISANYFFRKEGLLVIISVSAFLLMLTLIFSSVKISGQTISSDLTKGKNITKNTIRIQAFNIIQVAVSLALLICALIIIKQMNYIKVKDIGLNKDVVEVRLPEQYSGMANVFKKELLNDPSVALVSITNASPLLEFWMVLSRYTEDGIEKEYTPAYFPGDESFISTLGIKLIDGRNFTGNIASDKNNCLINEALARKFSNQNLIGAKLPGSKNLTVTGIVKDFHFASLKNKIEPGVVIYDNSGYHLLVKPAPGLVQAARKKITSVWENIIPDYPVNIESVKERYEWYHKENTNYIKLIGSCCLISIFLSMIGLFAISYNSSIKRTKEIGIRKINGAKTWEIMALLNKEFIRWLVIAFIAGAPVTWYVMHKWLENFAYKTAFSWWIFLLAGIAVLTTTLLTVSWQSWRAATKNPVEALRYE